MAHRFMSGALPLYFNRSGLPSSLSERLGLTGLGYGPNLSWWPVPLPWLKFSLRHTTV